MRIAVIGAGIVGVTTAFELAHDGHEVTVVDRRPSVAAEASFANAGLLSPGCAMPWAAPGMPAKILAALWARHGAVRFGSGSWSTGPWLWRYLNACRKAVHTRNRTAMLHLAQYSQQRVHELSATFNLQFEQSAGLLVLLRTQRDLSRAQKGLAFLTELGVPHAVVDGPAALALEPGLHADTDLHAAIHLPHDGVGNCRQFAHLIKALAQGLGADFRFGRQVLAVRGGTRPEVVWRAADPVNTAPPQTEVFDAVVVCAGIDDVGLLASLGMGLPMIPVYGYSITAPVRHLEAVPDLGPRAGLIDERYKVAVTRLGQRLRVAGGAEIGGHADRMNDAALRTLYKVLQDWFPGAADLTRVQHWKGARPMLPDGPPVIGASGTPGVWLNLGHGASGWALSCGSARLVADQLGNRTPAVEGSGFAVARLR